MLAVKMINLFAFVSDDQVLNSFIVMDINQKGDK